MVETSGDGSVRNILYQPRPEDLPESEASVELLAGLVWCGPGVAESLVKLYSLAPVDSVTYMGADRGADTSLQMSLYYDLLPAACSGVTRADFEEGRCGKTLRRGRSAGGDTQGEYSSHTPPQVLLLLPADAQRQERGVGGAAAIPRVAGQVSGDWWRAGHVTSVLVSDWSVIGQAGRAQPQVPQRGQQLRRV